MVRRDDLIQAVYDIAVDAGAKILFERYVVEVDENKPSVTLSDGTVMEADLIVGADGKSNDTPQLSSPYIISRCKVHNPPPPLPRPQHRSHNNRPSLFPLQYPLLPHVQRSRSVEHL